MPDGLLPGIIVCMLIFPACVVVLKHLNSIVPCHTLCRLSVVSAVVVVFACLSVPLYHSLRTVASVVTLALFSLVYRLSFHSSCTISALSLLLLVIEQQVFLLAIMFTMFFRLRAVCPLALVCTWIPVVSLTIIPAFLVSLTSSCIVSMSPYLHMGLTSLLYGLLSLSRTFFCSYAGVAHQLPHSLLFGLFSVCAVCSAL